jgi:hypothetical protein
MGRRGSVFGCQCDTGNLSLCRAQFRELGRIRWIDFSSKRRPWPSSGLMFDGCAVLAVKEKTMRRPTTEEMDLEADRFCCAALGLVTACN